MAEGNSIISVGELSKPAVVLVEKISEAIGGICKPWQMKRVAKAEAEAERIKVLARVETTELEKLALGRFIYEETKKQKNIENITHQSLPQLNAGAKPEGMEEDWITNFFDKCRLISDEEMQSIWARILAGEANTPGKFSKRTINFMESLDKQDAKLFTKLCAFNWILDGGPHPLIYNVKEEIYTKNGINFSILKHLDAIGLISFESLSGYKKEGFPKGTVVTYKDAPYLLKFPNENDNHLNIGKVLLTSIGSELASICVPEVVAGLEEYVVNMWKSQGVEVIKILPPPL